MLGDIGSLSVRCMQQVTKGNYHLLRVSDYYVKAEGQDRFEKCLQRLPTEQPIPLDCSVNICEKLVVRLREF